MGEGIGNDAAIMPWVSSANIACGYHAGNEAIIQETISLCVKYNVAIGAHPGFDDKANFGRKAIQLSSLQLYELISVQLSLIDSASKKQNTLLRHVKVHGALYNMAAVSKSISLTIAQAVKDFNTSLIYYGLSGSEMIIQANAIGLITANEVFADRTYQPDGTLTPRTEKNALIASEEESLNQVMQMIKYKTVATLSKEIIPIQADTICLHGDGEHAVQFAKAINTKLKNESISITSKTKA
jgi:UPF0271 protein